MTIQERQIAILKLKIENFRYTTCYRGWDECDCDAVPILSPMWDRALSLLDANLHRGVPSISPGFDGSIHFNWHDSENNKRTFAEITTEGIAWEQS